MIGVPKTLGERLLSVTHGIQLTPEHVANFRQPAVECTPVYTSLSGRSAPAATDPNKNAALIPETSSSASLTRRAGSSRSERRSRSAAQKFGRASG